MKEAPAPVQVKKTKKKTKTDVKPVQRVFTNDGKEPDDGETQPMGGEITQYIFQFCFASHSVPASFGLYSGEEVHLFFLKLIFICNQR